MPRKETIKIRHAREEDRFGDPQGPVPAWIVIPGATVVPRQSQDYEQRGAIVISGFMVALPGVIKDTTGQTVELADSDEVEIRGEVYQVDGAIGDYGKKIIFYTMRAN